MIKRIEMISASETQFALRCALGPLRAWGDFLADLARETPKGVHVCGFTLLPAGIRRDRCGRPLYAPRDVAAFIRNVWAADPSLRRDWRALEKQLVEIEDSPLLPWRMREAVPVVAR
jgi:hypothetical protein